MYSYSDRASYSRIDKDGLLGVSDTVNAMQDCCLFHSERRLHYRRNRL